MTIFLLSLRIIHFLLEAREVLMVMPQVCLVRSSLSVTVVTPDLCTAHTGSARFMLHYGSEVGLVSWRSI